MQAKRLCQAGSMFMCSMGREEYLHACLPVVGEMGGDAPPPELREVAMRVLAQPVGAGAEERMRCRGY
jgi:hypothetical protein